ncbi:uncharacterized protein BO95DRAFT_510496 [Aspergillus brunneoviolaceus CBS 621.78]|uniref:Uncharacterized protein n=1 Tax=Aspergillus brunneoviolaceus CBS 621.78 TaxID=1450534 RepID=A0ACD1GNN7_9EURO|nr:hypothetical protein BO95DRAFT_510496 [Aspergillus brunneoviolaceus CBS 621.78]RAH50970.1 hypothetical protein BO95DRAFT_510496 [Aspergillus brunneoviolaceus CBS 621.78]
MSSHEPKGRQLHELPPEIFQQVLTDLDPATIKALCLTTRALAEKCLGPRDHLIQPVLVVSPQNLRALGNQSTAFFSFFCLQTRSLNVSNIVCGAENILASEFGLRWWI